MDSFCDANDIAFDALYERVCALEGMLQMGLVLCASLAAVRRPLTVAAVAALLL